MIANRSLFEKAASVKSKTEKKAQNSVVVPQDDDILLDPLTDELASPELFFGLVGAIGTDLGKVCDMLKRALHDELGYATELIKLTDIIANKAERQEPDRHARYLKKMKAGTAVRNFYKRADAVILKGLLGVRAIRRKTNKPIESVQDAPEKIPIDATAFVFNSLKRPEEVETLRRVYGKSFFLIGAYSPRESRVVKLAEDIAESRNKQSSSEFRTEAEQLIEKDRADHGEPLGQAVQKTFPESDVFINVEDDNAETEIRRFIRLIFADAFFTPSRFEQAMFFAKAAALRSADLGRQVGAVIISAEGDVVATGTNEVPKAKGGQYWEGDKPDKRDFKLKEDANDKMRHRLIGEISTQLESSLQTSLETLSQQIKRSNIGADQLSKLITEVVSQSKIESQIANSQMTNLIAYFRAVHGEMSALMDAARRGIAVKGMTLVCTTFPCHECARHVIAAGISKVIFIEPYAKSLTLELYRDSVVVDDPDAKDSFVHFIPFVGVAPRQFMNLFDASRIDRKTKSGDKIEWERTTARPRQSESPQAYIFKETKRLHFLDAYDRKHKAK
jgi:cytidine deaminase